MLVSILHRVTGNALALGAVPILLWWLLAAASGPDAYAGFHRIASGPLGYLAGVGVTWLFLQHMANGIRHLVMDTGHAFEIEANKRTAAATLIFSFTATLALWALVVFL